MSILDRRRVLLLLAAPLAIAAAPVAGELVVMVSGGFYTALNRLAPMFTARTGIRLRRVLGASMGRTPQAIPNRLADGERADVVILAQQSLQQLMLNGLVRAGTDVDLVRSKIAMVVKAGAPKPGIADAEQLRQALLAARSVAYSDSASGVYLTRELFPRLGIVEEMAAKAAAISGRPVAKAVASGEFEIGFQQLSELLPIAGVTIVGLLPPELQRVTIFAGGIATSAGDVGGAQMLLRFLSSPDAVEAIRDAGLEPAFASIAS